MADLNAGQRRGIRLVAMVLAAMAVVLTGLSLLGYTDLPVFIPLLLLVAAAGLFIGAGARG